MAITHSPTRRRLMSPIFTAGRPVASILTTATSLRLSVPMILALNSRLSVRVTMTSSAPSTTCALVMTKPSAVRMKPEPTPRGWSSSGWPGSARGPRGMLGGTGMPKRLKNSSICSSMPPAADDALAFSRVRMLTTDGPTWSTRSVKSGNVRVCAHTGVTGSTDAVAAMAIRPAAR